MIPDFKTVLNFVWKARSSWFNLGVQLNIKMEELQGISRKYGGDTDSCLAEMLLIWLKITDPAPSWEDLAIALEKDSVDSYKSGDIASEIREIFKILTKPSTSCELFVFLCGVS